MEYKKAGLQPSAARVEDVTLQAAKLFTQWNSQELPRPKTATACDACSSQSAGYHEGCTETPPRALAV